ncbi:AAA family ATPase [Myroides odoratimimus]|uniref:nSTAND3 domain-containing NTPase n=1 Tax=Myroides odoratimimus TaxID=76832 RepID=UPI002577F462|nr:ATP-binding protein [Myroides odoratimimus]MDM1086395.1 ATP-binding protein [Myroides odoratimimus]
MEEENKKNTIRKVATAKQTGGGGFAFEDKTTGWFIAHFLADRFPFENHIGKIKRIDFQVRPEGWLFDDLLLTVVNLDGEGKVAISCKSNVQVNSKGPTKDLLNDLWNQYLGVTSQVFDTKKDYLCIVSAPLLRDVSSDLNKLLIHAKTMDVNVFYSRISENDQGFSKKMHDLFKSFNCPKTLADQYEIDELATVNLLSRLLLLEFDFQNDTSKDTKKIVDLSEACLRKANGFNADKLYESMCAVRSDLAPLSGFLDYHKLVDRFRNKFDLIGYKNHESDWKKIREVSSAKIYSIPERIGNKVSLPLEDQIQAVIEKLSKNNVLFILGQSGYGKSVLAKKIIETQIEEDLNFVWIDAQSIEQSNLTQYFGLENSISDVCKYVQHKMSFLVIDGIDRFFKEEQLNILYEILDTTIKAKSYWKVVFTCQTDDYNDVVERLYRINVLLNADNYKLSFDISRHLPELRKYFPGLSDLFKHQHLKSIFNNLKYLDLIAFKLSNGLKILDKDLLGETTLIDWIWKEEIDSISSASARLLQDYAEKQAQRFAVSIPVSDFNAIDLSFLDALKNRKILYEVDDKLYLTHDLFGDWARYKLIRSNSENLNKYLLSRELASSLWRKAIRLYGIYLLEKKDNGESWTIFFRSLSVNEPKEKIIQDLLLESIFFSANTGVHLVTIFDFLKEREGDIFKRFLDQFLMKATLANQVVLKLSKNYPGVTISEAASYNRIPNYVYWPQVIDFLFNYRSEVIPLYRKKIAIICEMWLNHTEKDFPYRDKLASIALENAINIFNIKQDGVYISDDVDEIIYKSFLAGVNEYPEDVIDLAMKLCKRIEIKDKLNTEEIDDDSTVSKPVESYIDSLKTWERIKFPDGPYEDPDDAFEKICINSNAITPLILAYPEKAKEILLALFIDSKKEISFRFVNYRFNIKEQSGWFPPYYNRGPFIFFLYTQPLIGLRFVITLINFACKQWADVDISEEEEIPKLIIKFSDDNREYIGDNTMYFWYRDCGNCPHTIVSALQALEKFLFDTCDNNGPLSDYIDIVLKEGNSTAYLGVINSLGKYRPDLYLKELKPLLQVYEFYLWESTLEYGAFEIEGHQMIGAHFFNRNTLELAKEWNELPHRKISIKNTVLVLFVKNLEIQKYFKSILVEWTTTLIKIEEKGEDDLYLSRLITFFNVENYEFKYDGEHSYLEYKAPKELTNKLVQVHAEKGRNHYPRLSSFENLQDIKKGKKYNLEQSIELWKSIQEVAKTEDEDPYELFNGKYKLVLGRCAVLLYNKQSWELEHPEFTDWTISYVKQVLDGYACNFYSKTQADIGDSLEAFIARILGILWTENVRDKQLRRLVGQVVLKVPYSAVSVLFTVIFKKLNWSDENFVQVQNLLIQFSMGSYRDYSLKSSIQYNNLSKEEEVTVWKRFLKFVNLSQFIKGETKEFNLEIYSDKILKDFVDNKTPTELISWSQIGIHYPKLMQYLKYSQEDIKEKGFKCDKYMLSYSLSAMPDIEGLVVSDRKYLLVFWEQIVEQLIFDFGDINGQIKKEDKYPDKFDSWALEKIAKVVLDIKQDDEKTSESFWKPIFDYGYLASSWIEQFLLYYFCFGVEGKVREDRFFVELIKMIAFANDCIRWEKDQYNRGKKMWESLVGVSDITLKYWKNEDNTVFYQRLVPETIKWGQKHSYDQDVVYKILYILKTKPGETVLREGIEIVTKHLNLIKHSDKIEVLEGYVRVNFKYEDFLAGTVSYLWENYKKDIKRDEELLNNFKEIITFLVARQNLIGLELQERVIM